MVGLPFWIGATVGVIMMMDALECSLHALRLHWVEFNQNFFKGGGFKFVPFSFVDLVYTGLIDQDENAEIAKAA